jgi:hypothetical protein
MGWLIDIGVGIMCFHHPDDATAVILQLTHHPVCSSPIIPIVQVQLDAQ